MIKKYYLPFDISADVNYLYLFSLYDLADYNTENKRRDIIHYKSLTWLAEMLSISRSTLNRLLNNPAYKSFFSQDKVKQEITLHNNFKKQNKEKGKSFILLTNKEVSFLRKQNDNLLCRYYIYIKKFCGIAQKNRNKQDFTAKQFLSAIDYCTTSNSNLDKIANYNKLLVEYGFISITVYRDQQGRTRNIYNTICF